MRRWLFGLVTLAVAVPAGAIDCTNPNNDGLVCLMSDNATQGGCSGGACIRTYTIPGNAARTGTGTISSSGVIVTGSGTVFTTELKVGDVLTAGGQRVAVRVITSDTTLTTDPAIAPAVSASAFTYTNPVVRWLDENGNTVAILDSRGLVAFGQAWANGPITVIGGSETGVGVVGKFVNVAAGTGGPAGGSTVGGNGGEADYTGGRGGPSSSATLTSGSGSAIVLKGGLAGANTGGGPVGAGGDAVLQGASAVGIGAAGRAAVRGGGAVANRGDVLLCDDAVGASIYNLKMGQSGALLVDCISGDLTKIKNVPVAGLWNVNAFQQANAGGM